ncbi:hypothetical protein V1509DRAFT_616853 [Lipomyces kononenkoae]
MMLIQNLFVCLLISVQPAVGLSFLRQVLSSRMYVAVVTRNARFCNFDVTMKACFHLTYYGHRCPWGPIEVGSYDGAFSINVRISFLNMSNIFSS